MKTCKAKKMYGLAIMLFSIMLVSPTYAQNGPKGTLRVGAAKRRLSGSLRYGIRRQEPAVLSDYGARKRAAFAV